MNTVRFIVLIIWYNEYNRRCEYMRKITSSIDIKEIALTIYNGGRERLSKENQMVFGKLSG